MYFLTPEQWSAVMVCLVMGLPTALIFGVQLSDGITAARGNLACEMSDQRRCFLLMLPKRMTFPIGTDYRAIPGRVQTGSQFPTLIE